MLFARSVFAGGTAPTISYILDGNSASIVANPIIKPVEIKFSASESIPNWVSVKIEKIDDSSVYKTFSPNSCDGTAYCTQIWNGSISPKDKILINGVYEILVHIKRDTADSTAYDTTLASPYTIKVNSSISNSSVDTNTTNTPGGVSGDITTLVGSPPIMTSQKTIENQTIKTKIGAPTHAFVGAPVSFSANTTGYSGELLYDGKYFWNFGDGSSTEIRANSPEKISHTFYYPGEYLINLGYYRNYYSPDPDASDKIILKVVPAGVSILRVGNEADFFIELLNEADYDMDISGWMLLSDAHKFIFPKNTILSSKKKTILPPQITGFDFLDKASLKLADNNWETVFKFQTPGVKDSTTPGVSDLPKIEKKMPLKKEITVSDIPVVEGLGANASGSEENRNGAFYWFGLAGFLAVASTGVYFVRREGRKNPFKGNSGDDFEIIDE